MNKKAIFIVILFTSLMSHGQKRMSSQNTIKELNVRIAQVCYLQAYGNYVHFEYDSAFKQINEAIAYDSLLKYCNMRIKIKIELVRKKKHEQSD